MSNGGSFTTVRAFYRKQGRLKYISHLDMVRCISRALKRSRLPVWHTMGFNPHIYLTFALPLALGCESVCESFDFRLTEEFPYEEAAARLNAVLPEGLTIYLLAPAQGQPEGICWADYEITAEYDDVSSAEVLKRLHEWLKRPEILAIKKTKKGEREMDLKPHFSVLEASANDIALHICLRCAAGAALNINPTLVLDRFAADCQCVPGWLKIVRTAVLIENLKDFI